MQRIKDFENLHYLTRLPREDAAGLSWACSCPAFLKRGVCKHVMTFSMLLGTHQVDSFLNEKRKRGRPPKAKPSDALRKTK
jgi:uncharacterized Zn finger protein